MELDYICLVGPFASSNNPKPILRIVVLGQPHGSIRRLDELRLEVPLSDKFWAPRLLVLLAPGRMETDVWKLGSQPDFLSYIKGYFVFLIQIFLK